MHWEFGSPRRLLLLAALAPVLCERARGHEQQLAFLPAASSSHDSMSLDASSSGSIASSSNISLADGEVDTLGSNRLYGRFLHLTDMHPDGCECLPFCAFRLDPTKESVNRWDRHPLQSTSTEPASRPAVTATSPRRAKRAVSREQGTGARATASVILRSVSSRRRSIGSRPTGNVAPHRLRRPPSRRMMDSTTSSGRETPLDTISIRITLGPETRFTS